MNSPLFQRAVRVIPGGIPGHQSPVFTVPGQFPYFAKRAEGPFYWDEGGNRYIDFLCAYGPLVLGAGRPEVAAAVAAAEAGGICFNHPTEWTVRLAERLVEMVDIADWAFFGKNGADMTYWSIRVAREHTGRRKILRFLHAYHGTDPWCTDCSAGVVEGDRADILQAPWNDTAALNAIFDLHGHELAGIISTPFDHPNYADMTLPDPAFQRAIRRGLDACGGLWIYDDVRCGFRHHLGGTHRYFDCSPDLICYSKALANGYAIAACVGRESFRAAASKVFATGSFWNNPGPFAAALATIDLLEQESVIPGILRRGQEWVDGFLALGEKHGIEFRASGTPALPYIRVADDPGFFRQQAFCATAIKHGIFLHPHHNWFIGHAHSEAVLEESLARVEAAILDFQVEVACPA
ncbi:MAG: aminotransferase class III-fold pyridoxal phosphate-dependent enzyme [Opitutales bacterium]|nr:aminotransferase class III-fold pyridoxal phosphate-dependent enzyme [Opitutales bacterium]